MHKLKNTFYLSLLILSFLYITLSLLAPQTPTRFRLSAVETHLLLLTIIVPVVLIWAAAVYGAEQLMSYARKIVKYPDGAGMSIVATGLTLLVASIMLNGVLGSVRPWALRDGWLSGYTIFINYIAVLIPFAAYWFIYRGSERLRAVAKIKSRSYKKIATVGLLITLVGILYIRQFLEYKYKTNTPDPSLYNSYYLSEMTILLTIVIPNLIGWTLGLLATVNLTDYQHKVKGIIYKSALKRFTRGIVFVISFAILLQLTLSFSTALSRTSLGAILGILYMLILLYAVGYLFIASGAKKLNKIEKAK